MSLPWALNNFFSTGFWCNPHLWSLGPFQLRIFHDSLTILPPTILFSKYEGWGQKGWEVLEKNNKQKTIPCKFMAQNPHKHSCFSNRYFMLKTKKILFFSRKAGKIWGFIKMKTTKPLFLSHFLLMQLKLAGTCKFCTGLFTQLCPGRRGTWNPAVNDGATCCDYSIVLQWKFKEILYTVIMKIDIFFFSYNSFTSASYKIW